MKNPRRGNSDTAEFTLIILACLFFAGNFIRNHFFAGPQPEKPPQTRPPVVETAPIPANPVEKLMAQVEQQEKRLRAMERRVAELESRMEGARQPRKPGPWLPFASPAPTFR